MFTAGGIFRLLQETPATGFALHPSPAAADAGTSMVMSYKRLQLTRSRLVDDEEWMVHLKTVSRCPDS